MLSLSMIVRDEAERLGPCLEAVKGFVDEMVIVDTGSRDNTIAIAREHGATVREIPWPGDFVPARNQALEWVRGDWVLVLDADEILRAEAKAPLRALMAQGDVLLINLLRFEQGALQSPYSSVSRLFRRHPALSWSREYHAAIDDSVSALLAVETHWRIADCPEPALIHGGYRPERLASGHKAHQLRQAMERELRRRPKDPYILAKLGGLEISEGRQARGIKLLRLGLHNCPAAAHPERYELLLHLAIALASSDPQEAETLYRQALSQPLNPRLTLAARLNLAALLLERGAVEEAAHLNELATGVAPEVPLGWYNLGLIRRRQGNIAAALEAYGHSLKLAPEHAESHQNLAVAQLLGGNIDAARISFGRAIQLLSAQGRPQEAQRLKEQAGSLVKLDA